LEESLEVIHANQANMSLAEESLKMTQAKFEIEMAITMAVRDVQLALGIMRKSLLILLRTKLDLG
jgi:hypothetical protein